MKNLRVYYRATTDSGFASLLTSTLCFFRVHKLLGVMELTLAWPFPIPHTDMRFRSNISNPKFFHQFCSTLHKVYGECIIKLDKTRIRFICQSDLADGTQVWGGVKTSIFFSGFRIESQNNDEIYCAVNLAILMSAIKSGVCAIAGL